jgi:hypothetical protein
VVRGKPKYTRDERKGLLENRFRLNRFQSKYNVGMERKTIEVKFEYTMCR